MVTAAGEGREEEERGGEGVSESASSAVQWKRPVPSDCCFHAARRDGGDEASRVPRISEKNREDSAAAVAVRSVRSTLRYSESEVLQDLRRRKRGRK